MPAAQLTWLDLTATDRDKVRQVLTLFSEQGTVDELGLGSLRDMLSNTLFPGLSVLHTRLRYVLFIPWVYQQVEALGPGHDPAQAGRERELQLIEALAASDDTRGIIGIMARPPRANEQGPPNDQKCRQRRSPPNVPVKFIDKRRGNAINSHQPLAELFVPSHHGTQSNNSAPRHINP